jgi:hypothetical protein
VRKSFRRPMMGSIARNNSSSTFRFFKCRIRAVGGYCLLLTVAGG